MTADSSLIGRLLEDLMPTKGTSEASKSPAKSPAMEIPSQVLNRRLSHHRRRSSVAPADENENPGGLPSQPEKQQTGRESLGSLQQGSRESFGSLLDVSTSASPSNRRMTADASQLDQIFRDLLSPNTRSRLSIVSGSGKRGGKGGNRRDTADPEALRMLIDELRSPSADKSTLGRVFTELGVSPTQLPEWGNVTVDASMLGRLTEDLDAMLNASDDALDAPSPPPAPPARAAPSSAARRMTADPCSLEMLGSALGLGNMDDSMSLQSLPAAPSSSGKKPKTPPPKTRRRDTASPGALADLLNELQDGEDSEAMAMQVSEEAPRSSATKKSPRLTRTHSVPTPPHADPSPPPTFAEQSALSEFSMSPPRAPPSARRPLRSCLSSKRKTRPEPSSPVPASATKKVVFGSPQGASFFKNSPSNSLTPMTKRDVQHYFPDKHGLALPGQQTIDEEVEEVEEGVTAQNSAILAAFEGNDGSDDESIGTCGSTSSSKRKRVSRSPRPKRRQSLLMSAGSSGFYGIRDDDEEGEEGSHEHGPPRPQRLSAMEMRDDEDDSCPMDVSPQPGDDMDDMPDIGERSPSFRSRDERTSAQLGKPTSPCNEPKDTHHAGSPYDGTIYAG
jgi:hypothetical protein